MKSTLDLTKPSFSRYLLSLPERLLRALAAGLGGLVYEITGILLPAGLRRSRLYQAVVYRLLRLTVELVGGVPGVFEAEQMAVGELALRKGVGNVLELAGFLAVGWSPLWVLAAASDLTGGTRLFLNALVAELQKDGLLDHSDEIASVDELLKALETSSGAIADLVDVPPVKVSQLSDSWQALKAQAGSLPEAAQLARLYEQMQHVARQEGRTTAQLSSLLAAGALRAGVQLGSTHIFEYYRQALGSISAEGWGAYALRVARPYYSAVLGHFDPGRSTFTEKALTRLCGSRG